MTIQLTSPAFKNGGTIPDDYTCNGENVSPPLAWANFPADTESFALTIDDPDAPSGIWVHWVLYNLPPQTTSLAAGQSLPESAREGYNDFGSIGYGGPCPPSGKRHNFVFKIYALDTMLNLQGGAMRRMLISALDGHILDEGQLIAAFGRD